jgi:transposase
MTIEEENEFLSKWQDKALNGLILTIPELHGEFNKSVGKIIPRSTIYRMLHRHNWRKVKPDTKHPKSDPVQQEEFKKKFRFLWVKVL